MQPIRNLLAQALASSLVVACGGIDESGFEPVTCTNLQPDLTSGLNPAAPYDRLELRSVDGAERGLRIGQCVDLCDEQALVVHRGGDVQTLTSTADVIGFLGEIDTETEALWAVSLEGYSIDCDHAVKATAGGYEVLARALTQICDPVEETQFRFGVARDGAVTKLESHVTDSESGACIGRRPEGLVARPGRGGSTVGAYFAHCARLEAASVHAFAVIERELRHHGAPAELVQRTREARRDEVRHARTMRRLTLRHGGQYEAPRITKQSLRTLEAMAVDNATEGCVRETFGALVGQWQARTATDPEVRRVLAEIAEDETRHAELSWALDAWLRTQLDEAAWNRVEQARSEALRELERGRGATGELVHLAGMPDGAAHARLTARFVQLLAAA